jgi:hypothetical protein
MKALLFCRRNGIPERKRVQRVQRDVVSPLRGDTFYHSAPRNKTFTTGLLPVKKQGVMKKYKSFLHSPFFCFAYRFKKFSK